MTAKEMFEELGYELEAKQGTFIIYNLNTKYWIKTISFFLPEQNVECYTTIKKSNNRQPALLMIKDIKAIQKQIKELKWLDE